MKSLSRPTANMLAGGIILVFTLLACFTLYRMPPFENPDEADHFIYAHILLEDGKLPEIGSNDDPVLAWNNEAHQPPLYYAIAAVLIAWSERDDLEQFLTPNDLIFTREPMPGNYNRWLHHPVDDSGPVVQCSPTQQCDTFMALLVLRGVGVLLAAVTLWYVYVAGKLLAGPEMGLLAMLLCASLPAFISVSTSVSNDVLVNVLYAVLIVRLLNIWLSAGIRRRDILLMSVLLALLALTKLTAGAAFALVYGVLIARGIQKRFSWRDVGLSIGTSLLVTLIVSGWWYVRNQQLYGDPLAMDQTLDIWARQSPLDADELGRLWRSFWLQIGNFHYAPNWLLIYGSILTVVGVGATVFHLVRERKKRGLLVILLVALVLVLAQLLFTSIRIDVLYGRLLFPALTGFSLFILYGLYQFAGTRGTGILILPLTIAAGWSVFALLPTTYERLTVMDSSPPDHIPLDATLESLQIISYRLDSEKISPGDDITGDIIIKGRHDERLVLVQSVIYLPTLTTVGQSEGYPGLADTQRLESDQRYIMPLRVTVDQDAEVEGQLTLRLFLYDVATGRAIPITLADGTETDALLFEGPPLE
ncbi:MAG: DUF2142 domain-containing protein [Chloroflexi bacterium]|nr:DUF2142 domain-containing protein [Chloroflexota bacterium]